jgi:hypothetical protein
MYKGGKNRGATPWEVMQHIGRVAFRSEDGYMGALAHQYDSATITRIKDMLFAEGGAGRAIGTSYHEAVERHIKTRLNKLGSILEPLGEDSAALRRMVYFIENPAQRDPTRTKIERAADQVSKLLDEERQYLLDAGIEIGEVTEGGYFPAIYDEAAIEDAPDKFMQSATLAYLRTYGEKAKGDKGDGITRADARQMAEAWLNNIRLGSMGVRTDNMDFQRMSAPPSPSFLKPRVFTKQARDILRQDGFTVTDPVDVLQQHFTRSAPKAEFNRRFAPEKWALLKEAMMAEGATKAIPEVVRLIQSGTGMNTWNLTPATRSFASFARLWSTLEFLPRAAISSVHEATMNAVSTGSAKDAYRGMVTTFKELYNSSSNDEIREISEDLLGTTGQIATDMMLNQRMGGYVEGDFSRHLTQKFFQYTGLHALTEAQRVAAVGVGRFYLRRLAQDIVARGNKMKSAEFFMQDMGINQDQAYQFSKWILTRSEGMPTAQQLDEKSQWSEMYITAMQRHVDRTIQNPNPSTRPLLAKHPIISLAYNLQSFIYAFTKNVLFRQGRLAKEAFKSGKGYTMADRMALLKPSLMMVIPLAMAGMIGELRDEAIKDPAREEKEKDGIDRLMRALSRFGAFGAADPYINMFSAVRYRKEPSSAIVGPLGGSINQWLMAVGSYFLSNSENTNTAERNLAKATYNMAVQPILNAASSLLPGGVMGAAGIQIASHPATREAFVQSFAGEPRTSQAGTGRGRRNNRRSHRRNNRR